MQLETDSDMRFLFQFLQRRDGRRSWLLLVLTVLWLRLVLLMGLRLRLRLKLRVDDVIVLVLSEKDIDGVHLRLLLLDGVWLIEGRLRIGGGDGEALGVGRQRG